MYLIQVFIVLSLSYRNVLQYRENNLRRRYVLIGRNFLHAVVLVHCCYPYRLTPDLVYAINFVSSTIFNTLWWGNFRFDELDAKVSYPHAIMLPMKVRNSPSICYESSSFSQQALPVGSSTNLSRPITFFTYGTISIPKSPSSA